MSVPINGAAGAGVEALVAERARTCRLTPDRALETVEQAAEFLADRQMLTRTTDCSLPSLFEACHEDPYRPAGHGFASWPKTKYRWAGELEQRPGCLVLKIHRGKNLLLTGPAIDAAAPICLDEIDRMRSADRDWARLLDHLGQVGPSTLEDLQRELALAPRELRALRSPLERCGALVSRQRIVPAGEEGEGGHRHTSEVARFDQVHTGGRANDPRSGFDDLIVSGVQAAVLASEKELARWFSWQWRYDAGLVDRLVAASRLARPAPGLLARGAA